MQISLGLEHLSAKEKTAREEHEFLIRNNADLLAFVQA
ncbi:hypothetical protein PMI11_00395 [Rhizobium sp. CF142]|nr:hypothetical protein PMI11_00395 [Rhizobium sp. CF142]